MANKPPGYHLTKPRNWQLRRLLEEVGVDRIEVASARVSDGEFLGVQRITEWARKAQLPINKY
jgi:isopropylmalate/homocitrate/citramalate synthase